MHKSTLLFIGLVALPVFFGLKARAQGVAINTDGTTPATMLHVKGGDANSNLFEILRVERIDNNSAGAASIGASQTFFLESTTDGTSVKAGSIDVILDGDATAASPNGSMLFNVVIDNVSTEVMRVDGTAGSVGIGSNAPGALLDVVSGTTTGIGAKVDANALTTGSGFQVNSLNAASTGNALLVSSNSTGAQVNGIARMNFTGDHTNNGLQMDDVTTAGIAMKINANALTTGDALNIASTSTGLTSGSLLRVSSATTGAVATDGIVLLTATGAYTSATTRGLLSVIADNTVSGTIQKISGDALTTGDALLVESGGTGLTSGSLLKVSSATTGAVATDGIVSLNASGAYTSAAFIGLLSVLANSTASGYIQRIEGNALTTGRALSISSTGTGLTSGVMLHVHSATTSAVATNGIVYFNAAGNYTSVANKGLLTLTANATQAGTIQRIEGDALTTGTALSVASSTTGLTGNLASIALSGNNAGNTNAASLLNLNSNGALSTTKALNVNVASSGALTNGGVYFGFSDAHTGTGFKLSDATASGFGMEMVVNSLTNGAGFEMTSSTTGLSTGSLMDLNLSGNNAANTGTVLQLQTGGALNTAKALSVTVGSTGNLASGGVLFSFSGAHTGQGFRINDVTTAGTAMQMNVNSLVGGKGLHISSTATGLTGNLAEINLTGDNAGNTNTSNLLYINSSGALSLSHAIRAVVASTGNLASGGIIYEFTGNHTGTGFQVDDVTTTGTAMKMNTNSLTTGDALNIASTGTGLTSGSLIDMSSASTGLTGSLQSITLSGNNAANTGDLLKLESQGAASIAKALNVVVASTGNFSTTGAVSYNFNGNHTGIGFALADATTTGTAMAIGVDNLTTGNGLVINSTSTGITDGSLLAVNHTGATAAMSSNGIVHIHSDANYTSAVNRGLLAVVANSTTAGTVQLIRANALTTGSALHVASTTTGLTNNLQEIVLTGNNAANTGNLLLLNTSGALSVAKALDVEVASTGNLTAGGVLFNFTGAHTGSGFQIDDATATGSTVKVNSNSTTTGNVFDVSANALTTGRAFEVTTSTTGLTTGILANFQSTGNNAANVNTGSVLNISVAGALTTTRAISLITYSTGNYGTASNSGGVLFNFSGAHTGYGFNLTDATVTGTAMKIEANSLTAGEGLSIASSTTALTGSLQTITLSGNNAGNANGASLLGIKSSGALSVAKAIDVSMSSTGNLAAGGVLFGFNGAHTGTGFQIDDVTTAGTAMKMNVNSLAGGKGMQVLSTATGLTGNMAEISLTGNNAANNGNLLFISSSGASSVARGLSIDLNSTGNLGTGGVLFDFAAHTGSGFGIIDATTTGDAAKISVNSITGGTGLTIETTTTGLTGSLQTIRSTGNNAGNTNTSNLLFLDAQGASSLSHALRAVVASTGNLGSGGVIFEFTGNHTGNGFQIDDVTTAGTAMRMNVNSITSGKGLEISSTATGLTGNLAEISITGNNAANTGNLLSISSSGALSTARGLSVDLNSTGNLGTGGVLFDFANHTSSGFGIIDATTAGDAAKISVNSLTSGSGLIVESTTTGLTGSMAQMRLTSSNAGNTGNVLTLQSSGAQSLAKALNVSVAATGNLTSGGVYFSFGGAHTGTGFQIDDVTTTGSVMKMNANSLTSGIGLDIVSTATALTGKLHSITLSGNNAANTGSLLHLSSSGALSVAKALNVDIASTGNLTTGGVLFNFSGDHTGYGFVVNDQTIQGVGVHFDLDNITNNDCFEVHTQGLTVGTGFELYGGSANFDGSLQKISIGTNNAASTGNLLFLDASGTSNLVKALNVDVASTGNLANGGVLFNFSGAHTGLGVKVADATATGTAVQIGVDALTTGIGLQVASSSTALSTGSLVDLSLTGSNANNDGNILRIANTGTLNEETALMITNLGGANSKSLRINDETGDADATPFIIDATGNVGIGTTAANVAAFGAEKVLTISSINDNVGNTQASLELVGAASAGGGVGQIMFIGHTSLNTPNNMGGISVHEGPDVAAGDMAFWTNTGGPGVLTEKMRIDDEGNVGIGSTDPQYKLDVVTTSTTIGGLHVTGNSLTTGYGLLVNANALTSGRAAAFNSSTTGLTGNMVEINLTGSNAGNANGSSLLNISQSGALSLSSSLEVYNAATGNTANGSVNFLFDAHSAGTGFKISDATATGTAMSLDLAGLSSGTGFAINHNGNAPSTGNVFIVSSISTGAETNGIVRYNFTGAHTNNGFQIDDVTATGDVMEITANSLTTGEALKMINLDALTSGHAIEATTNATAFTGDFVEFLLNGNSAGNTGKVCRIAVGTSLSTGDAATPLVVTNFGTGECFRVNDGTGDAETTPFVILGNGNVGIGEDVPTEKLHVAGNICYTGTSAACSDIRYKKDIIGLSNALSSVMQMRGVNYFWKTQEFPDRQFTEAKQIGFIAQELEKIYPEIVTTDENGYKAVDYSRLTPILVEAMKEQQKLIESQQTEIKNLQSAVGNLQIESTQLTNEISTLRLDYDSRLQKLEERFSLEAKK